MGKDCSILPAMFDRLLTIGLTLLLTATAACTAVHSVRTVGKGNAALETTLGGPFFKDLGGAVPAPNLFIGGRYGVRDDLDLSLNYNLTSPIVPGIGLDGILAAHYVPIQPGVGIERDSKQKGWSLATALEVHLITDFTNGAVAVPATSLAGGWRYKWFNPYLGLSLGLNFFRPYDNPNPVCLSPFVGVDFVLNERVSLGLRLTIYDVTYNMYGSQVTWVHLVNNVSAEKKYGMLGLALGFSYDFLRSNKKKTRNLGTGGAK